MSEEHQEHLFRVPDYFPYFSCKIGTCRNACCQGWPISITLQNYFDLLGLDCSPDLRRRLDGGMHLADNPSPEHYAQFSPRYDGNCPLRMEDGRCALHADVGEAYQPDICRLYPRGIRLENGHLECSCAASCEAVVELLLHRKEPITFVEKTFCLSLPPHLEERNIQFPTMGKDWEIRLYCIRLLQDRRLPLSERMLLLGKQVERVDNVMHGGDKAALEALLQTHPEQETQSIEPQTADDLQAGLWIAEKLTALLDARHNSIQDYGERALAYFAEDNAMEKYQTAKSHLETTFPDWETFFEHLLVNHMFFAQFPFQDRPESLPQEYTALCAVYILLRFLTIGCMADSDLEDDLVDTCAALFRLIEHTSFDRYAALMLKSVGCATARDLISIMRL